MTRDKTIQSDEFRELEHDVELRRQGLWRYVLDNLCVLLRGICLSVPPVVRSATCACPFHLLCAQGTVATE